MRVLLMTAVLAAWALPARAQSTATLRGVDVYRSAVLSSADAAKIYGPQLREIVMLRNRQQPGTDRKAEDLRLKIVREVAARKGVAWADLRMTDYYTAADHAMYAMFDVVDKADASRLAFAPRPKGKREDPDGLLAGWRAYVDLGTDLSHRGLMPVDRPNCPGFYCLWGGTPELDAMQKKFVDGASRLDPDLRRVLHEDVDGADREAALFVLSYSKSGREVTKLCGEALLDSDARVRGAALQILADVATHHPEEPIALAPVLPRLDDPSSAVRGKAMGLLVPLSERDAYPQVMLSAAPRLVDLMQLHYPESRDLAYTLLRILSKADWNRGATTAWKRWASKAAATGKP
jgi:hypothetical protein